MAYLTQPALEFQLLNDYQHHFPLCETPFATIAAELHVTESVVIDTFTRLLRTARIARIGAVFAPGRIGASTLAAMCVPEEALTKVAALVSGFTEVNHNYEREHRFNLWFVATSSSAEQLAIVLNTIEARCGLPVMRLPLEAQYHIDLGFDLGEGRDGFLGVTPFRPKLTGGCVNLPTPAFSLDAAGQALVNAVQDGLPLTAHPFLRLAEALNCPTQTVLRHIASWQALGVIKRFGVVVRHHELGYTANAMVVHDIPDALVTEMGQQLGRHPGVTLCYRRARVHPDWTYNLFCMVHGQQRAPVEQHIAELRSTHGLQKYPFAVLFSGRRFKQKGAHYASTPELTAQPTMVTD